MHGAVPLLALVLLLASGSEVVAADRIIYPPLQNNDAVVMEPVLMAEPYQIVPEQPFSMNVAYDLPPQHHYHNEQYDGIVYGPSYEHLPPNQHQRHQEMLSTQVDEYGRPIPPPAPRPIAPVPEPHRVPIPESQAEPHSHHVDSYTAEEPGQPVYDDEPFLHRALDRVEGSTDIANAVNHDLGELNVKEAGDDLTVHVGKNKVKTETVATITATITATDEHEDSYINIHRNAHEASAGNERDHLDGRTVHLDGSKVDALDQNGGTEVVPQETPAPDLSFLQDVEVLKVLFPWLEKHAGEQPDQATPKSLDSVVLT